MKFDNIMSKVTVYTPEQSRQVISTLVGNNNNITQINFELLVPYENQPFRAYSEEKLNELALDIKLNGVLSPVIVRPFADGKYQILAGHNRTNAAKLAGLVTVPCVIKECDDDIAKLIVVNTNLNQRQELLHSEKAFAYKMQLEAMKRHAGRPKENSCQLGTNLINNRTDNEIAEKSSDSARQIQRYIRLTYLIKPMLDMVDVNKMPFMVGVTLSFLSEGNQNILFNLINDNNMKITLSQAEELKRLNILGDFTLEMLDDFFNPPKDEKENKKKNYSLKLNRTQFDTIARALKNQRDNIDPAIYAEIIKLFELE